MQALLVPPIQGSKQQFSTPDGLSFMDHEVEMGFYDSHYFEVRDGVIQNAGCQRINRCSCDCNHCSMVML